jgi:hypothetical protein
MLRQWNRSAFNFCKLMVKRLKQEFIGRNLQYTLIKNRLTIPRLIENGVGSTTMEDTEENRMPEQDTNRPRLAWSPNTSRSTSRNNQEPASSRLPGEQGQASPNPNPLQLAGTSNHSTRALNRPSFRGTRHNFIPPDDPSRGQGSTNPQFAGAPLAGPFNSVSGRLNLRSFSENDINFSQTPRADFSQGQARNPLHLAGASNTSGRPSARHQSGSRRHPIPPNTLRRSRVERAQDNINIAGASNTNQSETEPAGAELMNNIPNAEYDEKTLFGSDNGSLKEL